MGKFNIASIKKIVQDVTPFLSPSLKPIGYGILAILTLFSGFAAAIPLLYVYV